jgi:solute carrier family 25 carnitine/acylcarnitine transporter 20/29
MTEKNNYINLLPGFFQGITRVTISYPFDVIKINIQKQIYPSFFSALQHLLITDPKRLYRGSAFSYVSVSIERSMQFYFLEKMNKNNNKPFLNGFILSLISSIYNVPVQFITTNIALNNINTIDYIKHTFSNKINVYKGGQLEILRNTMNSTIFMGTYYYLRNTFNDDVYLSPFYGAISGLSCWMVTLPLDTIRTDYQSSKLSIIELIKNRYNKGGIKLFYSGFTPILLRTIPSASAGMYVYENVRKYIND